MRFFGKMKITEVEAAGHFVIAIIKGTQECWPSIARELNQISGTDKAISEDQHAGLEFALAVIAIEIQALPNLFSREQANRIREYVLRGISSPELGSYPADTIENYQAAWNTSLEHGEPPFYGVSSALFDRLECESAVELGDDKFKSPLLLMALSENIFKFGGGMWKKMGDKFKIVP